MKLLNKLKTYNSSYFLCGILSSLAFPPTFLIPLILFLFVPLLYIYDKNFIIKEKFIKSWLLFCGHFTGSWYWICVSLTLDIETYFWLVPFAVLGLPAALSIIPASILLYNTKFRGSNIYIKMLSFASTFTIAEIIRSYIFTGFPWTLIGYIWSEYVQIVQICSIIGIFGLSFITAIIGCLYGFSIRTHKIHGGVVASLIVAMLYIYGDLRLDNNPTEFMAKTVNVIQPNIPQTLTWVQKEKLEGFIKHVKLTRDENRADLVIWPEGSIPFLMHALAPSGNIHSYLEDLTNSTGYLLAGVDRTEVGHSNKFWNSMFAFDARGNVTDYYDKIHLLPFGEYIPFSKYIPFIKKFTHGQIDFSFGDENRRSIMLNYPDKPLVIMPLICYEAVITKHHKFQEYYDVIVNITNDAWFGNSSGPYQHFYMTRIRAIEYGLPIIRAANTGISGIFDAFGRVIEQSNYGETIVLSSKIPMKAKHTFYRKNFHGRDIVLPYIYVLLILALFKYVRTRKGA